MMYCTAETKEEILYILPEYIKLDRHVGDNTILYDHGMWAWTLDDDYADILASGGRIPYGWDENNNPTEWWTLNAESARRVTALSFRIDD